MDLTAAPVDFHLNDKIYKAHPFRDIDHEEMNKWVRREYLKRVRESTEDPEMLKIALSESTVLSWLASPGRDLALTSHGMAKILGLMCRTDIDEKEVRSEEALRSIFDTFQMLHPVSGAKSEGTASGN